MREKYCTAKGREEVFPFERPSDTAAELTGSTRRSSTVTVFTELGRDIRHQGSRSVRAASLRGCGRAGGRWGLSKQPHARPSH